MLSVVAPAASSGPGLPSPARNEHAGAVEVGREVVGVVAGPVRGVADGIAPQRVRVGAGLLPHEAAVALDDLG